MKDKEAKLEYLRYLKENEITQEQLKELYKNPIKQFFFKRKLKWALPVYTLLGYKYNWKIYIYVTNKKHDTYTGQLLECCYKLSIINAWHYCYDIKTGSIYTLIRGNSVEWDKVV